MVAMALQALARDLPASGGIAPREQGARTSTSALTRGRTRRRLCVGFLNSEPADGQ